MSSPREEGREAVSLGMDERCQTQAIQLEPWHNHGQRIICKAEAKRWRYVRTARLHIPVSQFDRKAFAGPAANRGCFLICVLIEIKWA
jgi:hypothetical protein